MGKEKINACVDVAKNSYELAKELSTRITAYHWAVVILYYSLLMYLKCWGEYKIKVGGDVRYFDFNDHIKERDIIEKYFETSYYYKPLMDGAHRFRYNPLAIIEIQNEKSRQIIEQYFKQYEKCKNEICLKIKDCKESFISQK